MSGGVGEVGGICTINGLVARVGSGAGRVLENPTRRPGVVAVDHPERAIGCERDTVTAVFAPVAVDPHPGAVVVDVVTVGVAKSPEPPAGIRSLGDVDPQRIVRMEQPLRVTDRFSTLVGKRSDADDRTVLVDPRTRRIVEIVE